MRFIPILFVCIICITGTAKSASKPERYKATVTALLVGTVEGYIHLNLYGENTDRIKIDIVSIKENSGSFVQPNSTVEVLSSGIGRIIIDGANYKLMQINDGEKKLRNFCLRLADSTGQNFYAVANDTSVYKFMNVQKDRDQSLQNCLVKKVYGIDSFGIYQAGLKWNPDMAVVALHRKFIAGGASMISNPYFTTTAVWQGILFRSCPPLHQNIKDKKEGWHLTAEMSNDAKVNVWKNYIDQWVECGKAKNESTYSL